MSTSRNKQRLRTAGVYAALSAFCAVFSAVYEAFSHGVWSRWMILLALWPLMGGTVPYLIAAKRDGPRTHWLARWCHGAALAVCAVGSAVKGALDIYGTRSDLLIAYPLAGALLMGAAAALALTNKGHVHKERSKHAI